MLNLCHISSLKGKEICAFALIVCLITTLTPTAEGISVKLRGKIALGGILSGLACVTYALVTRDKRATKKLQLHLGPPDRVVQFERGFDRWRIDYHGEQCYLFRNNLFIETVPCVNLPSDFSNRRTFVPSSILSTPGRCGFLTAPMPKCSLNCGFYYKKPFLIHTPVSVHPKWSRLYLSRPQRVPRPVFSYLYQLEAERLLGPQL